MVAYSNSRDALLELLRIDASDLVANRTGALGFRQRQHLRRRLFVFAAACGVIGLLFVAGGKMSYASGGQWAVPALFGVLFIALGFFHLRDALGAKPQAVRRITGPVHLVRVRLSRGGATLVLMVNGERCPLPSPVRSPYKRWQAALTDGPYDVYVVGALQQVVGMEPVRT